MLIFEKDKLFNNIHQDFFFTSKFLLTLKERKKKHQLCSYLLNHYKKKNKANIASHFDMMRLMFESY